MSISPGDRKEVEAYTQWLANEMIELERHVESSPTNLFMAQTLAVANAVIATKDNWNGNEKQSDNDGLIETWKLVRWCGMFGRKVS